MSNFTRFSHWTYKKTKSFILSYPCGLVGTDFTSLHSKVSNHQNITSFYEHWFGLFLKDIDITRNSTINTILSLFLNYLYFAGMAKFMPHLDYSIMNITSVQFIRSVVSDSLRPLKSARQASVPITNSWSSPKFMSIESVMPSSHGILCRPLLLLPPIHPSIRVFSNESTLRIRWPKSIGVSASTSVLSMNTQDWSPLEWTGWISLQSKGLSRVFSNTTVQKHQFFGAQLS